MTTFYVVTHKDSEPTKRRRRGDYLAITDSEDEARQLAASMAGAVGYKKLAEGKRS
jgi:hypothetical protein